MEPHKKRAQELGVSLEQYVLDQDMMKEADLYKAAAQGLQLDLVTLKDKDITKELLDAIPGPLAQTHQVIAFAKDEKNIHIALLDPDDIQTVEFIHRKTGLLPVVHLTTPSELKQALRAYHADIKEDIHIGNLSYSKHCR